MLERELCGFFRSELVGGEGGRGGGKEFCDQFVCQEMREIAFVVGGAWCRQGIQRRVRCSLDGKGNGKLRVVIVPNNRLQIAGERVWYDWFLSSVSSVECVLVEEFPNPYDANTKRWESVWLEYLRRELMQAERTVREFSTCFVVNGKV